MGYFINPAALMPFFAVPCSVADKHLKLASSEAVKILLYVLRNSDKEISPEDIAQFFKMDLFDVTDCLDYWVSAGVISSDKKLQEAPKEEPKPKTLRAKAVKPTRAEVAKRGAESEKVRFLLSEAQMKFARPLSDSECSTLLWLFDDAGVDVSLILMAAQFSAQNGKCNIREIEKICLDWADNSVTTISEAEERIALLSRQETAWRMLTSICGIAKRNPSAKERDFADLFVNQWGFSREMIKAAYDICVDNTKELSFPYMKRILSSWHKDKIKTVAEIPSGVKPAKKDTSATYDMDAFLKKLNSEE
jgi:DnaD/phage-associated family protein